jgi:TusA-related sulfurtransferase
MQQSALDAAVARTDAPGDRPREVLDVSDAPPPEPLQATLERLPDLDDDVVLVQVNDRAPKHLYPKLADRGYDHDTVEVDGGVVTVVWRP